jgi:hypothetical protein
MTEYPHRKVGLWPSGSKKLMRGQEKGEARVSMMDVERKEELKKINQISITCTCAYMSPCAYASRNLEKIPSQMDTIDARRTMLRIDLVCMCICLQAL